MRSSHSKYVIINLSLAIVVGLLGVIFLKYIIPQHFFKGIFILTFIYFSLYELSYLWIEKLSASKPQRFAIYFSLIKGIRFIILLCYAVFYCYFVDYNNTSFLIMFGVCYIIWLLFDTLFYVNQSKLAKNDEKV